MERDPLSHFPSASPPVGAAALTPGGRGASQGAAVAVWEEWARGRRIVFSKVENGRIEGDLWLRKSNDLIRGD